MSQETQTSQVKSDVTVRQVASQAAAMAETELLLSVDPGPVAADFERGYLIALMHSAASAGFENWSYGDRTETIDHFGRLAVLALATVETLCHGSGLDVGQVIDRISRRSDNFTIDDTVPSATSDGETASSPSDGETHGAE